MEVKEIEFENYGKCLQISNGIIDVAVTIDFGPRIVRLGFNNEPNLLYNDLERKHHIQNETMTEYYGKNRAFYYYGGHRAWIGPERMPQTYYPDNEPVVYGLLPDGVSFTPPRQKKNDVQLCFEIILGDDATDIMIVHSAKNYSREQKSLCLCGITMLQGGGITILPQNQATESTLLPNRILTLWPYASSRDKRFFFGDRFVTLQHNSSEPFKFGVNNISGWAAYVNPEYTLMKHYIHTPAPYPDFGCSCEVYQEADSVSLESLSPSYKVDPGEAIRHVENISIYKTTSSLNPTDEGAIEQYINQLK